MKEKKPWLNKVSKNILYLDIDSRFVSVFNQPSLNKQGSSSSIPQLYHSREADDASVAQQCSGLSSDTVACQCLSSVNATEHMQTGMCYYSNQTNYIYLIYSFSFVFFWYPKRSIKKHNRFFFGRPSPPLPACSFYPSNQNQLLSLSPIYLSPSSSLAPLCVFISTTRCSCTYAYYRRCVYGLGVHVMSLYSLLSSSTYRLEGLGHWNILFNNKHGRRGSCRVVAQRHQQRATARAHYLCFIFSKDLIYIYFLFYIICSTNYFSNWCILNCLLFAKHPCT